MFTKKELAGIAITSTLMTLFALVTSSTGISPSVFSFSASYLISFVENALLYKGGSKALSFVPPLLQTIANINAQIAAHVTTGIVNTAQLLNTALTVINQKCHSAVQSVSNACKKVFSWGSNLFKSTATFFSEQKSILNYRKAGEALSLELPEQMVPHLSNEIIEKIGSFVTHGDLTRTAEFLAGWGKIRDKRDSCQQAQTKNLPTAEGLTRTIRRGLIGY